jgi:hypothetical protein
MFVSLNVLGSLVLDVTGNRLDTTFLDSTGGIRDTFTIFKDPQTEAEGTSAAPGVFAAAGHALEAKWKPAAGGKCEVKNETTTDKARGIVQVPATNAAPSDHLECKVTSTTPGFMTVAVGDILCVDVNSSANAVTPAATANCAAAAAVPANTLRVRDVTGATGTQDFSLTEVETQDD